MSKIKLCLYGITVGIINSLFGAGGGLIVVSAIRKITGDQKKAQASAVCIILPLSVITASVYIIKGYVSLYEALPYIFPGFIGAVFGSKLLKNMKSNVLQIVFSIVMLWAGVKLITK